MKKILSLVLVLSMVLGSIGFAFAAPADVVGTDYEDAVTRLAALEILSGFPDGTFRPEETVTRAQFAKIMVTTLGVGEAAKYAAGQTSFTDVAANHWAAGYINVASDMKIINGYGDGNFGPEDQVTYAQAVTMIVRALGYEPKAAAMGGYPGGYLAVAAEKEITDDVNVVNALAAIRGDVAIMVDASLTVPMMVQKTWGQYPEYEEDPSKTLMTTKLGVDEISGVVTEVPNTNSTLDADEIKIGTKAYTLKTDVNYDALLGLEVTVWADGSDVFFVDIDTDSDDIKFDTAKVDSTTKDITLYVEDDTFEWAKEAKAYVNFKEVELDEVPANAYGYVVVDSNDEIAFANFFNFDEVKAGVVTKVEDDKYTFYDGNANDKVLDLADYDDGVFVYTDKFVKADVDAIAVDSAIYAWETSDELYLIVENEAVNGTLERVKSDEIRVDGEEFAKSVNGTIFSDNAKDSFDEFDAINKLDNLDDEAVKVVLDLNGDAFVILGESEAASSTVYGIVTYGTVNKDAEITVFTKDGEEVTYTAEDRSDFTALDEDSTNYLETDANLEYALISFKLNSDGEIDNDSEDIVTVAKTSAPTISAYEYSLDKTEDKAYVTDGANRFYVTEDTIIMQTITDSTAKDLDPAVISYDDFVEMSLTGQKAVVYGDAGKDADMIVFVDEAFTGTKVDYNYGVVTDSPWKDGSDYVVTVNVFGEGEKEYVVKDSASFEKGDVVVFRLNSDDEAVIEARYELDADNLVDAGIDFDGDASDETVLYDLAGVTVDGKYLSQGGNTWKMDSDAVVYELSSTGKLDDEVGYNRIGDGDDVTILVNDDDRIVAAIINAYNDPTPVVEEPQVTAITVNGETVVDGKVQVNVNGAADTDVAAGLQVNVDVVVTATDNGSVAKVEVNSNNVTGSKSGDDYTYTNGTFDLNGVSYPYSVNATVKVTDDNSNVTTETITIEFVNIPEL